MVAGSPSLDTSNNGDEFGDGNPFSVQTFTGTADLHSIRILLQRTAGTGTTTVTMNVYLSNQANFPSGNLSDFTSLGTATRQFMANSGGFEDLLFNFSPTISLTAGETYFFLIEQDSGTHQIRHGNNVYVDGRRLFGIFDDPEINIGSSTSQDATFRINMQQNSSGVGDPHITTFNGEKYDMPIDDKYYCMLDTMDDEDRLIINAKLHVRKNGKSYFRLIYVWYGGEEIIVRLPNLKLMTIVVDRIIE